MIVITNTLNGYTKSMTSQEFYNLFGKEKAEEILSGLAPSTVAKETIVKEENHTHIFGSKL